MKFKGIMTLVLIAVGAVACTGNKNNATEETTEVAIETLTIAPASIAGEWMIDDISVTDSISIIPSDITSDEPQTVMFTDSTYHFRTNCNMVQGEYAVNGDSISFAPGLSTRMACPDMRVEDALAVILPEINTMSMDNDSTLRLATSNPSSYILLQKIQPE